jgi:cold shock CspA family protein
MFGIVVGSFPDKGICWIAPNGVKGQNHFGPHRELVEFSQVPAVGERVEFDSINGERGLYAAQIRPVSFS